jgi:hypothetical protein
VTNVSGRPAVAEIRVVVPREEGGRLPTCPTDRGPEPLTCGMPWPRGAVPADAHFELYDDHGQAVPLQSRVLDRWPDGSVRWVLFDWQADSPAYRVRVSSGVQPASPARAVRAR